MCTELSQACTIIVRDRQRLLRIHGRWRCLLFAVVSSYVDVAGASGLTWPSRWPSTVVGEKGARIR